MKVMLETTEWKDVTSSPNHIYVFSDFTAASRSAKVIAYSPFGTEPVQKFRTPMKIDLRGRTFIPVK